MIIIDQYVVLVTYTSLFSLKSTRLMTTDLKAANYVLFNNYDYPKPEVIRSGFRELFGSGTFYGINWGYLDDVTTNLYRTSNC